MARVGPPPPERLKQTEVLFTRIRERAGYVPESFSVMARVPGLVEAVTNLVSVVLTPGKVGLDIKWLAAHIASRAAGCRYCWAHTADNAHERAGVPVEKVEAAWDFESSRLFSPQERAAMRFAACAAAVPNAMTDEVFAGVREHFDEDQIVEIMAVIALFGWFNRWNDTMSTTLEDQPLQFAAKHLSASGWKVGKHAADDDSMLR